MHLQPIAVHNTTEMDIAIANIMFVVLFDSNDCASQMVTDLTYEKETHGLANLVNWRSFTRIDRKQHTHLLIACYLVGGHICSSLTNLSFILLCGTLMTLVACRC